MNIRVEKWQGHEIRFVEVENEHWAILKDLCDALDLRTFHVKSRLDDSMCKNVTVETSDIALTDNRSRGDNKTRRMAVVNELGIYQVLFASRRPEAEQLRRWTATVLQRLRKHVGLQSYEIMKMTEKEVQDDIDRFLDDIFYDDETKKLMYSKTVQGGDVEIYEFEDQDLFKE